MGFVRDLIGSFVKKTVVEPAMVTLSERLKPTTDQAAEVIADHTIRAVVAAQDTADRYIEIGNSDSIEERRHSQIVHAFVERFSREKADREKRREAVKGLKLKPLPSDKK